MDELVDLVFNFERLKDAGFFNGKLGTKEAHRWRLNIKSMREDLGVEMKAVCELPLT